MAEHDDEARTSVQQRIERLLTEFDHERAIQFEGRWFDWSYVAACSGALDDSLRAIGDDGDAPIALILRSRPWCLATLIALLRRGRGVVLLSHLRGDVALVDDVRDAQPAILVADDEDWARPGLATACSEAGIVSLVLRSDGVPVAPRDQWLTVDSLATHPLDRDVCVVALTSGTTGSPRRMPVTWGRFRPDPAATRDPGGRAGTAILVLPLFSIGGIRATADLMFGGRPISLLDRFDVEAWSRLLEDHRPRRAGAPPAVLRMVLDAKIPKDRFSSVQSVYTASAPLAPALATEFEEAYGIPIIQGYGATEFLGGVTGWPGDLFEKWGSSKRGSVGRPLSPDIGIRIVDPTDGTVLGPDEVGAIEIDSPNRVKGLADGWIRTSDLGRLDADGFLWIVGRSDDVVIRGGFKVDLNEVSRILESHPSVSGALVVAVADERLGSVPQAVVAPRPSEQVSRDDLLAWARERMSPYMVPKRVLVVDELPLNSMMKRDPGAARALLEAAQGGRSA